MGIKLTIKSADKSVKVEADKLETETLTQLIAFVDGKVQVISKPSESEKDFVERHNKEIDRLKKQVDDAAKKHIAQPTEEKITPRSRRLPLLGRAGVLEEEEPLWVFAQVDCPTCGESHVKEARNDNRYTRCSTCNEKLFLYRIPEGPNEDNITFLANNIYLSPQERWEHKQAKALEEQETS